MRRISAHVLILIVFLTVTPSLHLYGSAPHEKPLDRLSSSDRETLLNRIHESREQNPDYFLALQNLVDKAPEMAAQNHSGKVSFGFHLGQEPLFLAPALELLMVSDPPPDHLSVHIWTQVKQNLIYAIGLMRDRRSLPSLVALLKCEEDPTSARIIAESIARLESDLALESLLGLADNPEQAQWFRQAVLAGLGPAKREIAAKRLADELFKRPPPEYACQLLTALGKTAIYGGWSTSSPFANEEASTRTIATNAAVWAILEYKSDLVTRKATVALYLSSDAETLKQIRELRVAIDERQRPRLDGIYDDLRRYLENQGRIQP